MYLLTSERGLQHLILHLWCYPFSFNIFRPVREQWLQACSARESEPGVKGGGGLGQEPCPMVPKQEEQSRSGGWPGQPMALIARQGCGDGLGLKPSWEDKSAGERSARLGTGSPTVQLRQGPWARAEAKRSSRAGGKPPTRLLLALCHTALSQWLHPRL